jgi:hypothetical protein
MHQQRPRAESNENRMIANKILCNTQQIVSWK